MNGGSSVFLIFLLIIAAFAGLGYLVPELGRQTEEIQVLQAQIEELKAELERLQNQNAVLSQEIETVHLAEEEAQTENQILHSEISALEGEIFTALADLEEASELVGTLQQELGNEREKYSALLTEKENLEAKWKETDTKNGELAETLQDTLLASQLLQDENFALKQQIDAKISFQERFFSDKAEMSFLSTIVQSFSSKFNWVYVLPLILAVVIASGYSFRRQYRSIRMQTRLRNRNLDSKRLKLNESRSVTSETVTIQMPRQQLSKYITWLRQKS